MIGRPWGLSGTLVRYGNDCYSYYSVGNSVALFDPLCISYWYIIINFVQKSWAHVQSRWSYPEFVAEFDRLTPEDVVWEPYSQLAINTRAPFGISSVCSQDQGLWMTTTALVYDVYIEAHCPDRVRRQFGQRQLYPVLSALDRVQRHDHR